MKLPCINDLQMAVRISLHLFTLVVQHTTCFRCSNGKNSPAFKFKVLK